MTAARTDCAIPLVDLGRLQGSDAERAKFLAALREVAHEVGFFYLSGHGIDAAFLKRVLETSRLFFALPDAEKQAIDMVNSPHFRGYTRLANERTRGDPDWREQIDVGAERSAPVIPRSAPGWRRLQGPNQWPAALPELRPVVLEWQAAALSVLSRLMRAFSLALGQPEDALEPIYRDEPHVLVKLIRYPGREHTTGEQGVGAHKDAGLLSLLLQDDQKGLQVERDGRWVDVEPRPGMLVVNIGEILEMASDGYLRATLHRVVTPPAGSDRLSVAFFLNARLDATVPLLALPAELAAHARGPERDPANPLFRDVGANYLKGRLRSHPDVAQRYYADLLDPGARRASSAGH